MPQGNAFSADEIPIALDALDAENAFWIEIGGRPHHQARIHPVDEGIAVSELGGRWSTVFGRRYLVCNPDGTLEPLRKRSTGFCNELLKELTFGKIRFTF